jgi:hypothetical protein
MVIIIPDGINKVVIEKNGKKISISLWIMDYKWLLQNYLVGIIVLRLFSKFKTNLIYTGIDLGFKLDKHTRPCFEHLDRYAVAATLLISM